MLIRSIVLDKTTYHLVDNNSDDIKNIYTVIIGKNGSGKSRLLNKLTSLVIAGNNNNKNINKISESYTQEVEFGSRGRNYYIYKGKRKRTTILGDSSWKKISKNRYFTKIIAVSTSPFDKFPIASENQPNKDFYNYIGLKTSNSTYSKVNLINIFTKALIRNGINNRFAKIFDLLGYSSYVKINFNREFNELFSSNANELRVALNKDSHMFYKIVNSHNIRLQTYFKNAIISDKFDEKYRQSVSNNLNKLNTNFIEIRQDESDKSISDRNKILELLEAGAITPSKIILKKKEKNEEIDLADASSGEQCLLLTILCIAEVIKNNSIICIDEPELSLHPEWQSEFMPHLINSFSDYRGCHFIIATHSPQIISRLDNDNSYILKIDSNETIKSDNYNNKSADFQLATLFGAPGVENEYLNRITVKLLSALSKNKALNDEQKNLSYILFDSLKYLREGDTVKELILILKDAMDITSDDN